jgi:hypothetical protein
MHGGVAKSDSSLRRLSERPPLSTTQIGWKGLGLAQLAKSHLAGQQGSQPESLSDDAGGQKDSDSTRGGAAESESSLGQASNAPPSASRSSTLPGQGLAQLVKCHLAGQQDSQPTSLKSCGEGPSDGSIEVSHIPSVLQRLAAEHSRLAAVNKERDPLKELVATCSALALSRDPMARPSCNALLRAYTNVSPPQWQRAQVLVSCMLRYVPQQ